ncbi:hypothetical protein CLV51_10629 [Chitinophaga niastensis]|uniref:Uncharacterized protein n=1 Tax=Chitinophaga niastensis TaxID=536980 RepID=A0A2P8HD51_CHINA|nr:hypothetical protein CLV51_10629 [Chitinophaga niastensis]
MLFCLKYVEEEMYANWGSIGYLDSIPSFPFCLNALFKAAMLFLLKSINRKSGAFKVSISVKK